ncbi:unnamed protein product, partial [Mesorhabditis spiculigera]
MAGNFWQSSHREQWIFSKTALWRMRQEDLKIYTEDEYQKVMIFFCNLIQQIALDPSQTPKVRMQVVAAAFAYFKRFYARRSFKDIDPFVLAPTCIYLACKVEEFGMMSTSKLMSSVASMLKARWDWIQVEVSQRVGIIHEAEFILLEMMDCCLIIYHPYRAITFFIQEMKNAQIKDLDEIECTAWKICNDSIRGDFNLLYPPHLIALGCLIQAALMHNRQNDIKTFLTDLTVDYDQPLTGCPTFNRRATVTDVLQDLQKLYHLWASFDEKAELQGLLDKLPKASATVTVPVVTPQQHQQLPQQMQQQQIQQGQMMSSHAQLQQQQQQQQQQQGHLPQHLQARGLPQYHQQQQMAQMAQQQQQMHGQQQQQQQPIHGQHPQQQQHHLQQQQQGQGYM